MKKSNKITDFKEPSYEEYQKFAEFYDVLWNYKADLTLWLRYAKLAGGPVLELSCGTGRVTTFLAKKGFNIVGLDISENMLSFARTKVKKDNLSNKVKLIQGDMFDFDLKKKFNLVIIPLSSFYYAKNDSRRLGCLNIIYKHLNNGGLCVIDNYRYTTSSPYKRMSLVEKKGGPEVYAKIDVFKKSNKITKVVETFKYITKNANGKIIETKMRTVTTFPSDLEKMKQLAKKSGFVVKDILSGYGGEKKEDRDISKDRDIYVFQKK